MGKARTFHASHGHIMRAQRGGSGMHHAEGHNLVVRAMHEKHCGAAILGGDSVIRQQRAGKADQ